MVRTMCYVRKPRIIGKVHMKLVSRKFIPVVLNYYAVCIRCGYSGSDWPASGECPACGEVN